MLMSAIACNKAGLTFAAVHDSFWTHASDVDTMNVVLREAFIRMHSGDLVERLRSEFIERYRGHYYIEGKETKWKPLIFPPVPKKVVPANCLVDIGEIRCKQVEG
jgi:DNA-directed RNA polymerase, mitochondrial